MKLDIKTVLVLISMCLGGAVYVQAGDSTNKEHTDKKVETLRIGIQKQQIDIAVIKQILVKRYGDPRK